MSAPLSRVIELGTARPRIEVLEAGDGPPLLFLHGAGGIPAWEGVLPLLARAFRVHAPLLPGFGQSTGLEYLEDEHDLFLHGFDARRRSAASRSPPPSASGATRRRCPTCSA